jgi:predicted ATPase
LAAWRVRAGALGLPDFLRILADVYGKSGQIDAARDAIAEGLAVIATTEERRFEVELHRARGELLLLRPGQASRTGVTADAARVEAEACFEHAIAVARSQNAKLLELRAVLSLARLRRGHEQYPEARRMLEEIYGWFTEGFDLADLREVKALLDAPS